MKLWAAMICLGSVTWAGLWLTPDQQGQRLMEKGEFAEAAKVFRDPMRKGSAQFRDGDFDAAEQTFARVATAEAAYNRGNCLLMRGKYEVAIERYDRALELRPGWEDAEINRSIAEARAALQKNEGGDMGDQKLGADKIVFDKKKGTGGQDTNMEDGKTTTDAAMQSLWLRRVQTKPADFLKAKFSYQLVVGREDGEEETK